MRKRRKRIAVSYNELEHHYPWIGDIFRHTTDCIHRDVPANQAVRIATEYDLRLSMVNAKHIQPLMEWLNRWAQTLHENQIIVPPSICSCCGSIESRGSVCVVQGQ